ncbi:MAG TPA: hypothetical protein VKJ01_28150 [Candidatus Solibacter sp.]|jgi:hypothetical protein|nr:hypothetical protein [Candidatus Solibacter sp.]
MRCILFLCAAAFAFAQGTTPKPTPEEYPVHANAGSIAVGAEFMVHSFSQGEQTFIAQDYLVVEVALFPPKGEIVDVEPRKFSLRINGKRIALMPQAPNMVAASLNHREWQQGRGATADIGMGGVGVGIGHPRQTSPFPGAPPESRLPRQPRAPDSDSPSGVEKEPVKPEELVVRAALQEGVHRSSVSGFLYFAYQGKTSSIKSLELLYEGAVLKLR